MSDKRYEKVELGKFEEQIQAHDAKLADVYQPMDMVEYMAGGILNLNAAGMQVETQLNEVGWQKLCEKLGAPAGWLESPRCPIDLRVGILNRLVKDYPEEYLYRLRREGDTQVCRSVLSKDYLRYNHLNLWNDMRWVFDNVGIDSLKPMVWKPMVDDSLDAWILFEHVMADPNKPTTSYDGGGYGGLKPAIHFRNSEDGTGSVRIQTGLYRSYCTNGVIFGFKKEDSVRAIHMGNAYAMRAKVWQGITSALQFVEKGMDLYIRATEVVIEKELEEIVQSWTNKYSLSTATSKLWSEAVKQAQPKTVADFAMATSDFAGYLSNRSITTQMEEMAGAMLMVGNL